MLTENEVGQLLEIHGIHDVVKELHRSFQEEEPEFKDLSQHDFLSGMLMTPSVALARVDGTTSLFEELSLNKKARRFSKGGYFLQQDPVVKMVIHMQSKYQHWESPFIDGISKILEAVIPEVSANGQVNGQPQNQDQDLGQGQGQGQGVFLSVMKSSYILIRFLETFFLPEGEEITNKRKISNLEHQKILSIGDQLHLSQTTTFRNFIRTFEVK